MLTLRARCQMLLLALMLMAIAMTPGRADAPAGPTSIYVWDGTNWVKVRDDRNCGAPNWIGDNRILYVPNRYDATKIKWFDVSVHYAPKKVPLLVPGIQVTAQDGTPEQRSPDKGADYITWEWVIRPQPTSELVMFPDTSFHDLTNNVTSLGVSYVCWFSPEPTSLLVLGSGLVGLLGLRIRRRR